MSLGPSGDAVISSLRVDRNSPIPLYFQVAQHLERGITGGHIPPGSLFENEIQLAVRLGISRPTMRRAMQHLADRGLIVRRRGIGTRVVQPKVRRSIELTSLYDDLRQAGEVPRTRVLEFAEMAASREIAKRLACGAGTPVVRMVRLRSTSVSPIAKMTNFIPSELVDFDASALEADGLYPLLRARGVHLHAATQSVGARTATGAEAEELEEGRHAALLTITRTTFDDRGDTVEYAQHLYAASRYSFETHLVSPVSGTIGTY
ncbi:MAG: GntR family transcriptional regulator [Nocardioides sp.]